MSAVKKYSFAYRIYRKIRFLRYVAKLRKAERRVRRREEKALLLDRKKLARDKRRTEIFADKLKRRQDRQAIRELHQKLKSDQQRDFQENRESYERELKERQAVRRKNQEHRIRRRRRLARFYLRSCSRTTIDSIKMLNPANLPLLLRFFRDNRKFIREFSIICTHSTLLFVSAYLAIFVIMMGTEALSGVFFNYSSIIFYNEVFWLVKPEEWYQDSVQMIYVSGPVLCGIIAIIFAIVFSYMYSDRVLSKLFILWFFIHAFNAFFGALLIGSLFDRGIGYAIIWSYISDTEKVIYSIVSILALFLLGIFTTRSFLVSANIYYPRLENRSQRFFIWAQVILPFVIGNILIGTIMLPDVSWFNMTVALSLVITIIPIAIGYRFLPSLYFEEDTAAIKLRVRPIVMALAFIILYRLILGAGIRIG